MFDNFEKTFERRFLKWNDRGRINNHNILYRTLRKNIWMEVLKRGRKRILEIIIFSIGHFEKTFERRFLKWNDRGRILEIIIILFDTLKKHLNWGFKKMTQENPRNHNNHVWHFEKTFERRFLKWNDRGRILEIIIFSIGHFEKTFERRFLKEEE